MTWRKWVIGVVVLVVVLGAALVWSNLQRGPSATEYSSKAEGVAFYPACGNEILEHDGKTWYPIARDDWATPSAQALTASGGRGISMGVPMVAAPGPGDDVGTLYVYRDGKAYWVSDSGNLDTWLTLIPQTYNWVC